MLASGAAMNALGAAMAATAGAVSGAVSTLAAAGWTGPSGASTAASFAPNVGWMSAQAAKMAAIGATQIAFAEAYRAANVMIPKVPVVAENQTEHGVLQATNFLGINGGAIAANRTAYAGMWTAAGTAMNTYEAVGMAESTPIPVEPPTPITSRGVGMITAGASTGAQLGVGLAQGAMNAATSGLSTLTGAGTTAASAAPAAAQAAGTPATGGPMGTGGQPPAATAKSGAEGQQLTSLLGQLPQAAGQLPQALGSAPSAATQAFSGPGQAVMGPLQSLMTAGGSGMGAPAGTGVSGLSGMYPGSLASAANDAGGRSPSKSAGLTRSAGIGGGSGGFAMPGGWRTSADTLGIGAAPASGIGSGRAVAGGADLRTSAAGGGMGPMMAPMSPMAGGRRSNFRDSAPLSWEEDPFGAEEDDDLPMTLSASGERGT